MDLSTTFDHVALIVRDPARTCALLEAIFDAKPVRRRDADGHDETFVKLGGAWFVLVAHDVDRPLTGDHVAFHISPEKMQAIVAKLTRLGHAFQMARADTALYFTDFDNHVFEVNSTGIEAELAGAA